MRKTETRLDLLIIIGLIIFILKFFTGCGTNTQNKAEIPTEKPNVENSVETDKVALQKINLRQENGNWIILTVDETAEKEVEKEGKNYFFALRMDVHHKEVKAMLDRIGKAQMIYSMQNGGKFGDLAILINKGFVPQDAANTETTGYKYDVKLGENQTQYTATATPEVYGKTGKLSFALKITSDKQPELVSKDIRGKSF